MSTFETIGLYAVAMLGGVLMVFFLLVLGVSRLIGRFGLSDWALPIGGALFLLGIVVIFSGHVADKNKSEKEKASPSLERVK